MSQYILRERIEMNYEKFCKDREMIMALFPEANDWELFGEY